MGRVPTIYYCPYVNCTASYNRKHRYETHIRSHTGERPFICSYEGCGKGFTSSSHLQRHEGTHGSSFRCTVENCLEILKTKATLKKHMEIVHLKLKKHKVYTCTQCDKEFNKHNTLQRHELRHSGQLPYKCSVEDCEKAFLTPSKLKRHMKIHEGYPCKVHNCDKVFEKWTLYVQHMRDFHRPEYKCQVCAKVFTKSNALKLHAPIHEETRLAYPCQVPNCSRYYYEEKNLKWHMRKYHAKRPFMCDKDNCHRAFKTEADLAEHILHHGKRKPRKKNKPKKPKPSLAAILSGCAEVRQINRKSKQVITEDNIEPNMLASTSKVSLTDLETDTIKISSANCLEQDQSSIMEDNLCAITNKRNVSSTKSSEALCVKNLFESSHLNTSSDMKSFSSDSNDGSTMEYEAEMYQSTTAQELDSVCSSKSHNVPIECEINNSLTGLKVPESAVQQYTTIEVVDNENISQLISVPVIKTDDKNWNPNVVIKTINVHIETIS